ncbi:MAG: cysteine hydrolase, partial [Deltaproteobacteria bacterium]|nr:cysteine hydrolase [Deltaproteobacteria bacterium]
MPKKTLLIIDMLKDFVEDGAPLEVKPARKIVKNIKLQIDEARKQGIPIIYVCDNHQKDDPEFRLWPRHAVQGTKGAEVVDDIMPKKGDTIVYKKTYSGFFETELDDVLKKIGIDEVIITGV